MQFYSTADVFRRLATLKARLPSLKSDLDIIKSRGQDVSYPRITYTVLENFIPYAEEDAQRGEVKRSLQQVRDMEEMAAQARAGTSRSPGR